MAEVFYILATIQILLGIYGLWEGVRWMQLARRAVTSHPGFYAPRVALICPCKGRERGLEENLAALMGLDYANYEVFFVVANSTDPAHEILRRVTSRNKPKSHIVIAGPPQGCAEKVNNLRAAVEQLPDDFEFLVFTDSDGRPPHHWLRPLVAPLADARLGAVTTMRWYLPDRGGFWSAMATAWNAPIATYLGDPKNNFCWGGGTAIRRATFHQVNALDYWRGSVSDDFSLTRALRNLGLPILFAPECLVPSLHDSDFHRLLEFTNRQMIITRVYEPRLWMLTGAVHLFYSLTVLWGLVVVLTLWFEGVPVLPIFLFLLTAPLLAAFKGALRLVAVNELLPAWRQKLMAYGWAWTILAGVVPFLYAWNAIVAALTRRITWRGVHYELISPDQTQILIR